MNLQELSSINSKSWKFVCFYYFYYYYLFQYQSFDFYRAGIPVHSRLYLYFYIFSDSIQSYKTKWAETFNNWKDAVVLQTVKWKDMQTSS